jgi:formate dehydrogenase subunit delta
MSTDSQHLVQMANDIGAFFRANPDHDAAVVAISNHMKSFWTPKMRKKLIENMLTPHLEEGDEPLDTLPKEALLLLKEHPEFKPQQLPEGGPEGGGDAG